MDVYFPLAGAQIGWHWLVLLGFSVGTLQGFFGVGGGWLSTPSLNILGFPIVYAIGSDLAFTAGSAAVGSLRHHRLGNLDPVLSTVLGLSGMFGLEAARTLVLHLERVGLAELFVRALYVLLLWGVGLSVVLEYVRGRIGKVGAEVRARPEAEPSTRLSRQIQGLRLAPLLRLRRASISISFWVLSLVGVSVGAAAGLLGVGGGFILVPVLVYVLGVPTRVAVASSLFSIVLTAGYGAVSYGLAGKVELVAAGLLFAGAAVGVQLGALATVHAPGRSMRVLLGVTLLLAGLAVVLQMLQLAAASTVVMFSTAFAMTAVIVGFLLRGYIRPPTTNQQD